jgi:hypothetical protein
MADDAQQKQIALSLRQTNTISDRTTIEELGFDPERETRLRREEMIERNNDLIASMKANAEAQGMALLLQTKYQGKANDAQSSQLSTMAQLPLAKTGAEKTAAPIDFSKVRPTTAPPITSPAIYDMMAHHFIKSPGSPMEKEIALEGIARNDPRLAKAIKDRIRLIKKQGSDKYMKPLPEQKPPRRTNSPV